MWNDYIKNGKDNKIIYIHKLYMAELAIPLMAAGAAYIIVNKEDNKETFSNKKNSLPNVEPIPKNYPIKNQSVDQSNVKYYDSPNQATDKYFNQSKPINNNLEETKFKTLSGELIDIKDFKHENMVPHFGAKIKGASVNSNISEGILDNKLGMGSQTIKKEGIAPLFKPEENVQWTHGMPNCNDFYQSRVVPSLKMSNVKPWEEQQVGPGLGLNPSVNVSSCGYNSGMEARNMWMPKTVDELRTKTNPKVTFSNDGHEGPANAKVKNLGVIGKMEKYNPDTYFKSGPERWFTTGGIETAPTARSIEMLHHVNRPTTDREYYGAGQAVSGEAGYAPQNYHKSHRTESKNNSIGLPNGMIGQNPAHENDYNKNSYKLLPNNRDNESESQGFLGGTVKALFAPITDVLRPTRKENVIGNARMYGDAGSMVSSGAVYNPADRTKTTNREMLEGKIYGNYMNVQNQSNEGGYQNINYEETFNNRDTTTGEYIGNAAHTSIGPRLYNADYNQRNNVQKSMPNRPNQGGMQIFNQHDNIQINKRDEDRNNNRPMIKYSGYSDITSHEQLGKFNMPQTYKNISNERMDPNLLSAFKNNPYTQSLKSN